MSYRCKCCGGSHVSHIEVIDDMPDHPPVTQGACQDCEDIVTVEEVADAD